MINLESTNLISLEVPEEINKFRIVNYGYIGKWLEEDDKDKTNLWKIKLESKNYEILGTLTRDFIFNFAPSNYLSFIYDKENRMFWFKDYNRQGPDYFGLSEVNSFESLFNANKIYFQNPIKYPSKSQYWSVNSEGDHFDEIGYKFEIARHQIYQEKVVKLGNKLLILKQF